MRINVGKIRIINILSFFVILTTFISVDQWSKIKLGPPIVQWTIFLISYLCIINLYRFRFRHDPLFKDNSLIFLYFYIIWVLSSSVRGGLFMAEGYWDYKFLIADTAALLLPSMIFVFSYPDYLKVTIYKWVKYALPVFFLFTLIIDKAVYGRYVSVILLLGCFIPALEKKWKLFIMGLLIVVFVADFSARSQMIESAVCLIISFSFPLIKKSSRLLLAFAHHLFYSLPFILFSLAITGVFNVFDMQEYIDDIQVSNTSSNEDESLIADTRTFIYEEVITSAINNGYVLLGRSPARGYDSMAFGGADQKVAKSQYGRLERYASEVLHPNIFTWLGLIGLFLYSILYFISSSRAVLESNNKYIKSLGLFVAFRWMYGWVEDFNQWDIMNISLWMMISMCFSPYFRKMNDNEMKMWVRSCLPRWSLT